MRNNKRTLAPIIPGSETPSESILEMPSSPSPVFVPVHSEPVQLPSMGLFYHPSNPLFEQTSIEVKYPTMKEQDILINKSYINKQIAIDKLLESVIGNPSVSLGKMLLGDKNAIAYQTRIGMHGPSYKPRFMCPFCLEKIKDIDINLEKARSIKYPPTEEEMLERGIELKNLEGYISFLFTSKFGNVIEFTLATGETEDLVKKLAKAQLKNGLPESNRTNEFRGLIKSINNCLPSAILGTIQKLSSQEINEFLEIYNFINPDVSTEYEFECPHCGYEDTVPIAIDVNFFWYRP